MHTMLRSTRGITKLTLLVLLLASGLTGAVLSYLWTVGYYVEIGFKVPEGITTITVMNVTFPVENCTYFNVTVLNPSYSEGDANVTSIVLINANNEVIGVESTEPSIPYSLVKGQATTFKCERNWGELAGQTVQVVIFLKDNSGATFSHKTSRVRLEIFDADFDTTATVESFNLTLRNSIDSVIPLNLTQILFDSRVIQSQNITTQDGSATLPQVLQPGEGKTFVCYWNLWERGALGSSHTITAKTLQGYSATYKTAVLPSPVALNITDITFTTLPDTSGFNVTIHSLPSSPHFVDVDRVIITNGTQDFDAIIVGSGSRTLQPDGSLLLQCLWDWTAFVGQEIKITVHTTQGFFAYEYTYIKIPVASFTHSPTNPYTGTVVTFNASTSSDPDGTIVSYFWDFGDETNSTGEITTHTYVDSGDFNVTLTVTDNIGLISRKSIEITILNRPPIASFTENATTVLVGEFISFNATASYDADGTIVEYFWDFGDSTNATGILVTHAYSTNGTFIVTLYVTDDDGATASVNATKTVLPPTSFTALLKEPAEIAHPDKAATLDSETISMLNLQLEYREIL